MSRKHVLYVLLILSLFLTGCARGMTPVEGGEITVALQEGVYTLDPAWGFIITTYSAEKMVFDGLLDYDKKMNIVPRLAEKMPEINADATIYTFKLRKGVKFHNGRELVADDVVFSITRILNPKTESWGSSYFSNIKGAKEFMEGKATSVEGIKAIDPYTIQFTLTSSDVTFLNKMALTFAFIIPKEEVEKAGENFGQAPIGTGPYVLKEWIGKQLVFERNTNYFLSDRPYLDKIIILENVPSSIAFERLDQGLIQLMGDPSDDLDWAHNATGPTWDKRLERTPQPSIFYIAINTTAKPFDNVKVRQALNYAIDKKNINQLLNGRGTFTNQILPPVVPGYDANYQGYEYNPDKAKQLLAEAGMADGFETSIECILDAPQPKLCESFQQDLAKVGIKLNILYYDKGRVTFGDASGGRSPLTWAGGLGWWEDYPDPDSFYTPLFGCDSGVPSIWNWSRYCNEDLQKKHVELLGVRDRKARLEAYQSFFKTFMDEAVWVPIYNGQNIVAHSEKLHGQPTLAHPMFLYLFETMWIEH